MNIQIDKDYIIRVRRELHKVPEIGFDLPKTLAIVRRELDALGIPYTEEFGESSIVATLNEDVGSRTIGLRADMDLRTYLSTTSAKPRHNVTLCHSVCSVVSLV